MYTCRLFVHQKKIGEMYTLMGDLYKQTVAVKIVGLNEIYKYNFEWFLKGTACFCNILTMYRQSTCVSFDYVLYDGLWESFK